MFVTTCHATELQDALTCDDCASIFGDSMKLSDEQLAQVRKWAADGVGISGIQKRLEEDLKIRMTYMDVRFLLDDYSIEIQNARTQAPAKPLEAPAAPKATDAVAPEEAALAGSGDGKAQDMELAGGVKVEVDRLQRPGSAMSGDVSFSDGVKAKWYIDQMGRLGLDGVDKNYRPSPEDIQDFQMELQKVLQQKGF